jgi:hypothetical protein
VHFGGGRRERAYRYMRVGGLVRVEGECCEQ